MGKLHYFTALLIIILLAIASGWIFKSIENNPILTKEKPRHVPDYFLKNFTSTTMNSSGKITYKVKAKQLEHYPDDGSMTLLQPTFSFYENNIKIWTAQSNSALILQNSKEIHLEGNVILQQILNSNENNLANMKNGAMTLTSEQFTIEPKKNIAHTKLNIKLIEGNNYIQATGMRANLSKNRIEFLSKTRSHYVLP